MIIEEYHLLKWDGVRPAHEGFGIIEISGFYSAGKTRTMVGAALNEIIVLGNYKPEKVVSTVAIPPLGIPAVTKAAVKEFMSRMADEKFRDWLILVDEADQVWSHRDFAGKDQKKAMVNNWQMAKLGNTMLYTDHLGLGVDVILRDATLICAIPRPEVIDDTAVIDVINVKDGVEVYTKELYPVSLIHKFYERHQPVADN